MSPWSRNNFRNSSKTDKGKKIIAVRAWKAIFFLSLSKNLFNTYTDCRAEMLNDWMLMTCKPCLNGLRSFAVLNILCACAQSAQSACAQGAQSACAQLAQSAEHKVLVRNSFLFSSYYDSRRRRDLDYCRYFMHLTHEYCQPAKLEFIGCSHEQLP